MMAKLTLNMRIEPNRPPIAPKPSRPTTLAAPTMPISSPAAPPPMPSLRANGTRKTRTWNSGMPITTMARYMVRNCAVRLRQPERATGRYRGLRRRPRVGQQQDAAGHAEDDVRRPPAVPADQRTGQRTTDQGAGPDAGDGQAKRERPAALKPTADHGHHRHVAASDPDPHADPVGEVAGPKGVHPRGEQQPRAHRDGSDHQHPARPHPVHDRSAHHSEGEVDEAGEGEHGGRSGPTTAELAGHRVEELSL